MDPVSLLVTVLAALLGLAVGSFVNVVIWRVPRRESVVRPASHCPACGAGISARDNVPVLSWLLLRGRCRACRARISARYPAVELLTGVLFAVMALRFGATPQLVAYLYLCAAGVGLALIDIDVHRLPDVIVLPSYAVVLALLGGAAAAEGEWSPLLRALGGMVALFVFYAVLVLAYPGGMGLGDVKLAGVLGLALGWLGWDVLVVGGFLGFLLGGVAGAAMLLRRRATRRTAIPFGPFMLAGALVAVLVGSPLVGAYLDAAAL